MRRQLTPMRTGHTFKRPGGSGAYGDDGPPFGLRLSNGVHRGLRHFHELLMHDVPADILAAYGAERAVSDMKGHFGPFDARRGHLRAQFRGEMQARRRRGYGAGLVVPGVNGLVRPPILLRILALDIRRQRQMPPCFKKRTDIACPV